MGSGVDAVKNEIRTEFRPAAIIEHYDPETFSTVLGFSAEARNFAVRVSAEFDQDYASLDVDLEPLGPRLRASKDGKAIVKTTGISY